MIKYRGNAGAALLLDEMKIGGVLDDDETNRDPMTTASCSTDKENMEPPHISTGHSQIIQQQTSSSQRIIVGIGKHHQVGASHHSNAGSQKG